MTEKGYQRKDKPNQRTVFIDFGTTGLDEHSEQITQYAVIAYENGEQVAKQSQLVQLHGDHHINDYIHNLTGFTDEYLAENGVPEEQAYNELKEAMKLDEKPLIVGFNVNFDAGFLQEMALKYDGKPLDADYLDPLTITREKLDIEKLTGGKRLAQACQCYGIEIPKAHDAFNDTEALVKLTEVMDRDFGVEDYINRIGWVDKYGMFTTELNGVEYYHQPKTGKKEQTLTAAPVKKNAPKQTHEQGFDME